MMNADYMKNYYDPKLAFGEIREHDEAGQMRPPINISNINFIKNHPKPDDYSKKKRRRKSESSSSSSSSDSSSDSGRKKPTYKKQERKDERRKSPAKKEQKPVIKEKNLKISDNQDKKNDNRDNQITSDIRKDLNLIPKAQKIEEIKKDINDDLQNDSGNNTDDLLKNSPIIPKSSQIKKQARRERKTKFSSEIPILKKNSENEPTPGKVQDLNRNLDNTSSANYDINMINSQPEEVMKPQQAPEKKVLNLTKKTPVKIQAKPSTQEHDSKNIKNESKAEDKEEGEIEERVSKNFKIVQSEGRKKILLTNKRQVTEIKVVKRDNN
jgi:hypothetical protein